MSKYNKIYLDKSSGKRSRSRDKSRKYKEHHPRDPREFHK